MKTHIRIMALFLALAVIWGWLPIGAAAEEYAPPSPQPESAETVLSDSDYASANAIFAKINAAEATPAKKNASQSAKIEAAIAIVTASESYVEGSLERNGDCFTWWTTDGIHCVYSPRMRELTEDMTPERGENKIVNEPIATKGGSPTGDHVYLIGPYYGYDSAFSNQYQREARSIAAALGDVDGYTLYSGTAATVDKVAQAVSNGAVVIFDSHGSTDYVNPDNDDDFVTGAKNSYLCLTSITGLTAKDYQDGALYSEDCAWINGQTIANHMKKKSPSGLVWMAMCLSMATDSLCQPLRSQGVEVVYGYSQSVSFAGDYLFSETFWDEVCSGKNVSEAIATMKDTWGCWDHSEKMGKYYNYTGYSTLESARKHYAAFPIVVSDEDAYPGKRTADSYGADDLQTVNSTYMVTDFSDGVTGSCGANAMWKYHNGKLTISGSGETGEYPTYWQEYQDSIHTVEICEGITRVGKNAFKGYTNLSSVSFPSTLTSIGASAFADCDKLTSIALPSNLLGIEEYAFQKCDGLTSVTLPAKLESVRAGAFENCSNMTAIWADSKNPYYWSDSRGVLYSKDKKTLVMAPGGITGHYEIPDGTAIIDWRAFNECNRLTSVTIPVSITQIYQSAFYVNEALEAVYYKGDRMQWESADIQVNNVSLDRAKVHYTGSSLWIREQPSAVTVFRDDTAVFELIAEGVEFTCYWQYSTDGCATWKNVDASVPGYHTTTLRWESPLAHNGYQFRCRFVDAEGYVVYSDAICLKVVNGQIKQQPIDVVAMDFNKVSFSVDVDGYDGTTFTYLWQYSENGIYWVNTNFNFNGYKTDTITFSASIDRGNRWYRCKITDQLGNVVYSDAAWLMVYNEIFQIAQQPKNAVVNEGSKAQFAVGAVGTGLSYAWQYSRDGGVTWENCTKDTAGYNQTSLYVTATMEQNGYLYRCCITNDYGVILYSNSAMLTVKAVPFVIHAHPEDISVLEGETALFSVVVSPDENVTYQWQYTTTYGNGSWYNTDYPGSNTNTLSVKALASRNGMQYRCKVTHKNGYSVFSEPAVLSIEITPIVISQHPADITVLKDQKAVFHVEAEGVGLKYQWQFSRNGGNNWNNSSSATQGYNTDTLTVVGTLARNGFAYRCMVSDAYGKVTYTDAAILTVTEQMTQIVTQPLPVSVEENGLAVFSVAVSGEDLRYQWQYSTNGSYWNNSSSATQGYNTDTLTVEGTLARNGFLYRCKITDGSGVVLYSDAVALTVRKQPIKITLQPKDHTTKLGGRAGFVVEAEGKDLTYRWQYSTNGKSWFSTTSYTTGYNTASLTVIAEEKRNGFLYRCKITDGEGNVLYTEPAALTVDLPENSGFLEQPADQYRMSANKAIFTVRFQGGIASIQWQYQTKPGTAWYNSSSATQGYNTDTLTVQAEAKRNGFRYRCVITDSEGYIHTSREALLSITKAQFDSDPADVTAKAGTQTVMRVTVQGAYTQLYWQYSSDGGRSWYSSSFVGSKTTAMTVGATQARNGFLYRCAMVDADGNKFFSEAAMLTVY